MLLSGVQFMGHVGQELTLLRLLRLRFERRAGLCDLRFLDSS
jgi:hypothetical protein